ncbi:MAG: hypothetical protein HQL29_00805 [Candidatus Omnitrophica bacterium]|nr:hypothetical protein [Candidatus Omnitrophota bacterium]
MEIGIIIFVSGIIGIICLILGVFIGIFLGKTGSMEFLAFLGKIPAMIIKSPRKIKKQVGIWNELSGLKKIERIEKNNKIKEIRSEIAQKKRILKGLRKEENKIKWG